MKSTEELLILLLNHLAEKMKDRLILKGGMLLRLLQSPRPTQDLDFVLISKESRKVLVREIISCLDELQAIEVTRQNLNSRGIFLDVRDRESKIEATLEINVVLSTHLPPEPISTARVSSLYSLAGRVVSAMAPAEAFSNKIAASLERKVIRDIYDLSLFEPMTSFDQETLKDRLSKLQIHRTKPRTVTLVEAADLLQKRLDELTEEKIKTELYPLLPDEYRGGLLLPIRASVSRIIQKLKLVYS